MRQEFEQAPGDGEGQGSLACCSPQSHEEANTTEQQNSNNWDLLNLRTSIQQKSPLREWDVKKNILHTHTHRKQMCTLNIIYIHA